MSDTDWLVLVLSLPTQNATERMRVWRGLKAMGCGILRDGVYLLPDGPAAEQSFSTVVNDVITAGGTAQMICSKSQGAAQQTQWMTLFDRSEEYATLMKAIHSARRTVSRQSSSALRKIAKQLRREYDSLHAIDFFPQASQAQVSTALSELEATIQQQLSPDEPHAAPGKIARREGKHYLKRIWATRTRPWVDRLASAWLIGRFIDPHARFIWLAHPRECPRNAIGFDFDGATFTHIGTRVTFEVLLVSFSLETDAALSRLGHLVHTLDAGGIPLSEAAGVEAILRGLKEKTIDDDLLLKQTSLLFDGLYEAFRNDEESA
jgi:hypothetical protein